MHGTPQPLTFHFLSHLSHFSIFSPPPKGKPDTGGQVVYILDAVRALEQELSARAAAAGVAHLAPPRIVILTRLIPEADGTTCNVRREPVEGTSHAVILRIPFRNGGGVVRGFVSRFQCWPFLETFSMDAVAELKAELGGDDVALICGHYSDGGIVAGHLKERAFPGATLSHTAHALEKTKYPQAALRWASPALRGYNFGAHFTADFLAINRADFIITSTYNEIAGSPAVAAATAAGGGKGGPASPAAAAGTPCGGAGSPGASPGQYESMTSFVMPGLFRVVDGVVRFGGGEGWGEVVVGSAPALRARPSRPTPLSLPDFPFFVFLSFIERL